MPLRDEMFLSELAVLQKGASKSTCPHYYPPMGLCVPKGENAMMASCKSQRAAGPASKLVDATARGLQGRALPPREDGM